MLICNPFISESQLKIFIFIPTRKSDGIQMCHDGRGRDPCILQNKSHQEEKQDCAELHWIAHVRINTSSYQLIGWIEWDGSATSTLSELLNSRQTEQDR